MEVTDAEEALVGLFGEEITDVVPDDVLSDPAFLTSGAVDSFKDDEASIFFSCPCPCFLTSGAAASFKEDDASIFVVFPALASR